MPRTIPNAVPRGGRRVPGQAVALHRRRRVHLRDALERVERGRERAAGRRRRHRRPRPRHRRATRPTTSCAGSRSWRSARSRCRSTRRARPTSSRGFVASGGAARSSSTTRIAPRRFARRSSTSTSSTRDGRRRGPAPSTSRRRRDDPDLGHDRPVEARDADPPRLRDGGRGLPVLDAAHRRRPADDVTPVVPHQRARVLGARVGCRGREPRAASRLLRERLPRRGAPVTARPSSTRSARCSRSSCANRRAPTTPTTRCAAATPARRPTANGNWRSKRASGSRSCAGTRCRRSPYGLIWGHGTRPYGTLGSVRQHPSSVT